MTDDPCWCQTEYEKESTYQALAGKHMPRHLWTLLVSKRYDVPEHHRHCPDCHKNFPNMEWYEHTLIHRKPLTVLTPPRADAATAVMAALAGTDCPCVGTPEERKAFLYTVHRFSTHSRHCEGCHVTYYHDPFQHKATGCPRCGRPT